MTGLTAAVKKVWSKTLLQLINNNAVMENLVNTDYEKDIKDGGDTIHARLPGDVTINNYTREADITYQSLTWTDNTFALDQQKYWAFLVDDLDKAQVDVDVIAPELKQAAIKIRNVVDTRLLSHYANSAVGTTVGAAGAGMNVTKDNIYAQFSHMYTLLLLQNVPMDENLVMVVPPQIRELMITCPEMATRSTSIVDDTIQNGLTIKNFAGFKVYVTTNMAQVSGTFPLMFFHKLFISFASQVAKVQSIDTLPNKFGGAARGLYLYGSTAFTQYNGFGGTYYANAA